MQRGVARGDGVHESIPLAEGQQGAAAGLATGGGGRGWRSELIVQAFNGAGERLVKPKCLVVAYRTPAGTGRQ